MRIRTKSDLRALVQSPLSGQELYTVRGLYGSSQAPCGLGEDEWEPPEELPKSSVNPDSFEGRFIQDLDPYLAADEYKRTKQRCR